MGTPERTFSAARLYDAGGDTSQKWFVYYSYRNPSTGRMKRFKVYGGINYEKDKRKRRAIGRAMVDQMNQILHEGFNPFQPKAEIKKHDLKTMAQNYLQQNRNTWRHSSYNSKSSILNLFIGWATRNRSALDISEINETTAANYMAYILNSGQSDTSYNNKLYHLSAFFKYAHDLGYTQINPFAPINYRKVIRSTRKQVISRPELQKVKRVLSTAEPEFWLFVRLIYYCFIRPKELLGLRVGNFDLNAGSITIPHHLSKNKKTQTVILPDFLIPEFQKQTKFPANWFVFGQMFLPHEKPQSKNTPNRLWKKHVKDGLGISADMYSLKHRGAMDALNDGMDVRTLQMQLRHSSLEETEIYLSQLSGYSLAKFSERSNDL